MSNTKPIQNILCIQAASLFKALGFGKFEGFRPASIKTVSRVIDGNSAFLPRTQELESDESIKQIIPQIALVCGDRVCIHRIPETGSEERLRNKWPILFGGHMEEGDLTFFEGADREFREEVLCPSVFSKIVLGFLNVDNVDPVSRCHVGILMVFAADEAIVTSTKDEGVDGDSLQFLTFDELEARKETLTAWSQAALPVLRYVVESGMVPESPWGDFGEPIVLSGHDMEKGAEEIAEHITATVLNGAPGETVNVPLATPPGMVCDECHKPATYSVAGVCDPCREKRLENSCHPPAGE